MTQQALDLASSIKTILFDEWALKNDLSRNNIKWYGYTPTPAQIRNETLSISVTFLEGSAEQNSKAIVNMRDTHKIDFYIFLKNLEGQEEREKGELKRMLVKDQIISIIHDNQTAITGMKFGKYTRSARSDEVDSKDQGWFLHEIIYLSASWYHTES